MSSKEPVGLWITPLAEASTLPRTVDTHRWFGLGWCPQAQSEPLMKCLLDSTRKP